MTAHPIDTEDARFGAEAHLRYGGGGDDLAENVLALLDLLATAEHRATRAEAQAAIRGRAVAISRQRAEAWQKQYEYDMDMESRRADQAEARIKAVEDTLEESEARGPVGMTFNGTPFPAWISIATIRRALGA